MRILAVNVDNRDRLRSLCEVLQSADIEFDIVRLGGGGTLEFLYRIFNRLWRKDYSCIVISGMDRHAILWIHLNHLFRFKTTAIRLGGDPIEVPESRLRNDTSETVSGKLRRLRGRFRIRLVKGAMAKINNFICVSETLARTESLSAKNCLIVRNKPVSIYEHTTPVDISSGVKLLTVTNLNYREKYQGIQRIIRELVRIETKVPIEFRVAGEGDHLGALRILADETSSNAVRIVPLGFVHDVPRLLKWADIFVYDSRLDSWPNVLTEALGSQLPILANDCPQFREMFGQQSGQFLYDSNREGELANRLATLLNNMDQLKAHAVRSLQVAQDLQQCAKNTDGVRAWFHSLDSDHG